MFSKRFIEFRQRLGILRFRSYNFRIEFPEIFRSVNVSSCVVYIYMAVKTLRYRQLGKSVRKLSISDKMK